MLGVACKGQDLKWEAIKKALLLYRTVNLQSSEGAISKCVER